MGYCEDFPCCGHEAGCCPDFDESGNQLNMICTCGAKLPVDNRYSICDSCMRSEDDDDGYYPEDCDDCDDEESIDDEAHERYIESHNDMLFEDRYYYDE